MESALVASEIVPRARLGRVPELDGVRAIAVLGVLVCHVFTVAPSHARMPTGLPKIVDVVFAHGWLGVDLFFVLSGLLITSILLGSKRQSVGAYYGHFYERRALRILPLYLVLLAILALAYIPLTGPGFLYLSLAFAANLAPVFHVDVPNGAGPLWSLAVEEQFYLLWPVLVLLLSRRALAAVLFALLVFEPLGRFWFPGGEFTWLRCDGLAAGALLALWFSSPHRTPRRDTLLALGLIGVAAVLVVVGIPFGGLQPGPVSTSLRIPEAVALFAALVVFAVSRTGASATALLRTPFAILTAEYSYCLYLIHVPLLDGYQTAVQRFAPGLPHALGFLGTNLVRGAVVLAVAYALAAVSRRYLELPFLRMRRPARRAAVRAVP
jgi:peptidoglycan/LPS O-acetylase OafA/YrhL